MRDKTKRIMIAAPSSGSGKTTLTCGLLKCLADAGLDPVSYKCGPDYIDPMFHREVLHIVSRNLDSYLMSEDRIKHALAAAGTCPAVIEGVMGLYDGLSVSDISGSSYEIARITHTPVILCVDARGAGRTLISTVKGILADDTEHLIRGLVLNRTSAAFCEKLRPVLESELSAAGFGGIRLLGCIPRSDEISFDSRHLGLKTPGEIEDFRERVACAAALISENVDIDGILAIMDEYGEEAGPVSAGNTSEAGDPSGGSDPSGAGAPSAPVLALARDEADLPRPVLAVARDEAFCFYYQDNIDLLEQAGLRIRYFSPLHDERIPEDASGLLLGGGYPELYLEELSANSSMLDSVRRAIEGGMPSLAECGGFMYLHKSVSGRDGTSHALAGVIDGECGYSGHLVRFGYMYIMPSAGEGLSLAAAGMRGHEFHYYESTCTGDACVAAKPSGGEWMCMISNDVSLWGFPHFYYGSNPGFVHSFADAVRRYERKG